MTTRKIFSLLFAASFVIVSCKNELEPQESITEEQTSTIANDGELPNEPMVQSAPMQAPQSTPAAPSQSQMQAKPQTVAPGMNPAHGQPGHRCEIAVGAPLSSAPATTQKTQVTPQMTTPQAKIAPVPTNSTPSMLNPGTSAASGTINPAHGQPGHRCDVAVGQPLP